MSTSESLSNKVGNATDGTVGEETLSHQASSLASNTVEYVKGVTGLGGHKAATDATDAAHNAQGGHTLNDLVNEGRNLAANVLGQAQTVVGGAQAKAKDAAGDAQASHEQGKPVGYVAQAQQLAAQALGAAQSIVATGAAKVDHATTDAGNASHGLATEASKQADSATSTAFAKADEVKQGALDAVEKK